MSERSLVVLLLTAVAGACAQLIDGALGMGFGVTATTLMLSLASLTPATASAVVHTAELGTTLASGISHTRFGNVNWKVAIYLGFPGAIGAFFGALALSWISTAAATPVTALILIAIGVHLLLRFFKGRVRREYSAQAVPRPTAMVSLGLFGGFIDASGGGGWGPVTSSTLMTLGDHEPRKIVGTVNTAEFLVTLAATIGFGIGMWEELTSQLALAGALLLGGVITAPIAAWMVSRIDAVMLGGFVGTGLVAFNLPRVLQVFEVSTTITSLVVVLALVIGMSVSIQGFRKAKAARGGARIRPTQLRHIASEEEILATLAPDAMSFEVFVAGLREVSPIGSPEK